MVIAKANYENAKALFPSCADITADQWMGLFESPAGLTIIGRLLRDAFTAITDEEDRRDGTRGVGRRPPRFASLDVVLETVFPERMSMDPFPEAMTKLLGGRSQRAFALNASIHQTTLSKLMKGQYHPDMEILERIAEHARVSPGYFKEYRAMFLADLIRLVLDERPQMSSILLKDVLAVRRSFSSEGDR